jgi:hypothetical protein
MDKSFFIHPPVGGRVRPLVDVSAYWRICGTQKYPIFHLKTASVRSQNASDQ